MDDARPFHRRRWPYLALGGLLLASALLGATLGYFLRLDLPDVRALEDYNPPVMSTLLAADGSVAATFAEQRRMLIEYHDIPPVFLQALVATEDSGFYRHTGIDFKGILRAAWSDLRHMKLAQGASTLTQQLARNLFLNPEKTIRRKVQEAMLALEIERQYTKQEILRFYCNQIYMGHGRYGLEAAARFYFQKPARELTLTEAATLAALIQRPEALSPIKNPERALERRNHVLRRMAGEGMLGAAELAQALQQPLDTARQRSTENPAPYYVEEVRRWLQTTYGSSSLYKEGLEVSTTLDLRLQEVANRAVERGLRELDKRQGWRGVQQRLPADADPAAAELPSWSGPLEAGAVHDGVVLAVEDGEARVRVGPWAGSLGPKQIEWTGEKSAARLLHPGDVVRVRLVETAEDGSATLELEQEPLVEGALVALDPASGEILALVGGFDFERSEYDRAIQARRQTGSAFKPLVYAAALSRGKTLADTLVDEPTVFLDPRNPAPYQPENYSRQYYETVTLRTAIEKSANIATVKLLNQIGYDAVIDTAHRLGITSDLQPFPSLALGSFEITLLELTAAYAAFANQGVWVEPHLVREVRNRDGALVTTLEPDVRDAVRPEIAYLMNRVLAGVMSDGTGQAAASLGHNVAGKTGTTDDNTDAWFVGYSPNLALGVWVGFDEPRSLGRRETGAMAALPIWKEFMEAALQALPTIEFQRPEGITVVAVDRHTGLKANLDADCTDVIGAVFLEGTEPTEYCSREAHARLKLPYTFQRYALDEQGELTIPAGDLARLLEIELDVFLVDGGSRLEVHGPDGVFSVPLRVVSGETAQPSPPWLTTRFDVSEWRGVDGHPARVVWLD